MKNLTVSLDDDVYRMAKIEAAKRDSSVSALVRQFLTDLASNENRYEHLKRQESMVREQITQFDAGNRLSREELHESGA